MKSYTGVFMRKVVIIAYICTYIMRLLNWYVCFTLIPLGPSKQSMITLFYVLYHATSSISLELG